MRTFLIILFVVILIGCLYRLATEGTCSAYSTLKDNTPSDNTPSKPLSELSTEELNEKLSEVENKIEIQKIRYQSSLANPYTWQVTRNLIKSNLDSYIQSRERIVKEIKTRHKDDIEMAKIVEPISVADELKKLKELLDAGVLTQEEFDAQKKKILNQ